MHQHFVRFSYTQRSFSSLFLAKNYALKCFCAQKLTIRNPRLAAHLPTPPKHSPTPPSRPTACAVQPPARDYSTGTSPPNRGPFRRIITICNSPFSPLCTRPQNRPKKAPKKDKNGREETAKSVLFLKFLKNPWRQFQEKSIFRLIVSLFYRESTYRL